MSTSAAWATRPAGCPPLPLRVDAGPGRGPLIGQPLLGGGEATDVEERAQQLGPVLRLGAEEAGEVPLGQQHHLAELVDARARAATRRYSEPSSIRVLTGSHPPSVAAAPQLGLLGRPALAALLRPLLLGTAGDASRRPHRVSSSSPRSGWRRRVVAAQPLPLTAGAGDRAVEGEHDGVQQSSCRSGRAPEQEEPVAADLVEVDLCACRRTARRR